MRLSLLVLGLLILGAAEAGKKESKKAKAAARCTACRRVVTGSRAAVLQIREDLEPLREKKIETGRGADRVYNKRFTKTYDVELLHRVERVLEKSCAQRELMTDLELVRACRTLRDDSAEELVALLLHGDADDDNFCVETVEACRDEKAMSKVPTYKDPALRSQSESDAQTSWHLAAGSSRGDAVELATALTFFDKIVDREGDVLLLLYGGTTDGGEGDPAVQQQLQSELAQAWDELANELYVADQESEADILTLAALSLGGNDIPIAMTSDYSAAQASDVEVVWFGATTKDLPEALLGGGTGEPPPSNPNEFKQEIVRQVLMRSREKTYATRVNGLLSELNKIVSESPPSQTPAQSAQPPASAEEDGRHSPAAISTSSPSWARQLRERMREWSKPGALAEKHRAAVRSRLADLIAEMDETSPSGPEDIATLKDNLQDSRRKEEAAQMQIAKLTQELKRLRLEHDECQATKAL